MSILGNEKTRVICQGILTPEGLKHTEQSLAYGTHIVGGVAKGKKGDQIFGIPLYNTVKEAVRAQQPDVSVIYAAPLQAAEEIMAAIEAGVPLIVCTTERVPVQDILKIKSLLKKSKSRLIGPASQGIITAGACKIGTMPAHLFQKGNVGIMSRSSSVMYEALQQLHKKGLGVTTCVALGAYPVLGTSFNDILDLFLKDKQTQAILLIGEIGGNFEQVLAQYYAKKRRKKPLISYVVGSFVPPKTYMGNIGAIVSEESETASFKKDALKKAGSVIVDSPVRIGDAVFKALTQGMDKEQK